MLNQTLFKKLIQIKNQFLHENDLLKEANERKKWTHQEMETFSLKKMNILIQFVLKNNIYYKNQFKDIKIGTEGVLKTWSDIVKLPILTKELYNKAISDGTIFSEGYPSNSQHVHFSSGSTGTPTKLFVDDRQKKYLEANLLRGNELMGVHPYSKYLKIWRNKKEPSSIAKMFGLKMVIPMFDLYDSETNLDPEKISVIVKKIKQFKPDVIRGYVSALWVISNYLLEKSETLRIDTIIPSAEYLPSSLKRQFEITFGGTVFNMYGGSETPMMAVNPPKDDNLMLMDDYYRIEIVDSNNQPTRPGEIGRVLVTDFNKYGVPLIRYENGDLAINDDKIIGPFRTIKEIIGRTNDIFVLPSGEYVLSHNWHIYFRNLKSVERFKVLQTTINKIEIQLQKRRNVNENDVLSEIHPIRLKLKERYKGVTITWEVVEKIPQEGSSKFYAVKSMVPLEFNKEKYKLMKNGR